MIRSFRDTRTEQVYKGTAPKGLPSDILTRALTKLRLIDAATALADLLVPPGNRLERLVGDRAGQHSIRINSRAEGTLPRGDYDQWRICFTWGEDNNAYDVEIVDYH